jgi:hypothetical protein
LNISALTTGAVLCQAVPEERCGFGADQVPARTLFDPNDQCYLGSDQEIAVAVNDNLGL